MGLPLAGLVLITAGAPTEPQASPSHHPEPEHERGTDASPRMLSEAGCYLPSTTHGHKWCYQMDLEQCDGAAKGRSSGPTRAHSAPITACLEACLL